MAFAAPVGRFPPLPLPVLATLAVAGGLCQAASIASPWDAAPQWWLQLLSLALLVGALDRSATVPRAALAGWLFATAWIAGCCCWWLFISMHTYGGLAAPLAVLAVLGLAAFLALYYGAAAACYRAWAPASVLGRALLFGAAWLLAELLRGNWFTGFPWGAGGYAHIDGAAPWLAPWVGVYGLGAVAAVASALLAGLLAARRWGGLVVLAAAVVAGSCWPLSMAVPDDAAAGKPLKVVLLQGNIPQDEKFETGSGVPIALQWYAEQMQAAKAALVVAPETAIPLLPQDLPDGYGEALEKRFAQGEQAALFGIPMGSLRDGYSNSVLGFAPGAATPYHYDKHHLVPFGEFIPTGFRWFTQMMNIPLGDFRRGDVGQPSFAWQGQRLAPNICYEDLFGEELAQRFREPAAAPTIFVNASNMGWFGDSIAIDQHLNISRMRALEFARPLVRATNTGATVVINHRGQVTASLAPATRGVLEATVEGRGLTAAHGWDITPYARWVAAAGLAPLWLLALVGCALAAGRARWRRLRT